jgi:hypothetical protein
MTPKALMSALVLFVSLSASQALARHDLSPERLAKARKAGRQLNPPVDFDALMKEADRLGVECTGDLTRKARIIICGQGIENAQIEARIQATRADTEATRARIEATKARIEKIDKENAELIREIQRRIREDK